MVVCTSNRDLCKNMFVLRKHLQRSASISNCDLRKHMFVFRKHLQAYALTNVLQAKLAWSMGVVSSGLFQRLHVGIEVLQICLGKLGALDLSWDLK